MNEDEVKQVLDIKEQYEIKKETDLDRIKKLDRKAKTPSLVFGLVFGVIGFLVAGIGMCCALNVLTDKDSFKVMGYIIASIGIIMCSVNYPIYNIILKKGMNKYKDEILELSNKAVGR